MAITFVASAKGNDTSSGTTLDTSTSLNVAAGDILVAICGWAGASVSSIAVAEATDSSNAHTALTQGQQANSGMNMNLNYVLAATSNSSSTFRVTLGASRTYRHITVLQFRPDSGETVYLETGPSISAPGFPEYAFTSDTFSTTHTDEVLVAACWTDGSSLSNFRFSATAAGGTVQATPGVGAAWSWYKIVSAAVSNTYGNVYCGSYNVFGLSEALSIYSEAAATTHNFTTDDIATGAPTVGSPSMIPVILLAVSIATGAPTVGSPSITLLRIPVEGCVITLASEFPRLVIKSGFFLSILDQEYRTIELEEEDRLVAAGVK
jgi:hypothetical protein